MSDHLNPRFDDHDLYRILGSRVSAKRRQRHLQRVARQSSSGGSLFTMRYKSFITGMGFVAIASLAAVVIVTGSFSGGGHQSAVLAAERIFSELPDESARHIMIEGEIHIDMRIGQSPREWSTEAWERVNRAGDVERAVLVSSKDGDLIGRLIVVGDEWILDGPNLSERRASDGRILLPPHIGVAFMTAMTEWDELLERILAIYPEHVQEEHDGSLAVMTIDFTSEMSSDDRARLSEDVDMEVSGYLYEITMDVDESRLSRWRMLVRDEIGRIHPVKSFEFRVWETMDASEIDDALFSLD